MIPSCAGLQLNTPDLEKIDAHHAERNVYSPAELHAYARSTSSNQSIKLQLPPSCIQTRGPDYYADTDTACSTNHLDARAFSVANCWLQQKQSDLTTTPKRIGQYRSVETSAPVAFV